VAQCRGDAGDLKQPVADVVVFSNDFASRRERPRRPWATSTRQGVSDGAKDRLLVVPPDPADLDVVVSANCSGSSRGDTPVH
jgi:hypothetical protein